jgi:hypothetical protein
MAVERIDDHQRFFGIIGDVKPTDSTILNGSEYWEFDKDDKFLNKYLYYNGSWFLDSTRIGDSSGNILDLTTKQQQDSDVHQILLDILRELNKINIHFAMWSGCTIDDLD